MARSVVQVHPGPPSKSSVNKRLFSLFTLSGIPLKKPFCQPFVNFSRADQIVTRLTFAQGRLCGTEGRKLVIAIDRLSLYMLNIRVRIPRISPQTLRVLERFIEHPTAWRYGYELSRETGLKSGTLYPILMRLAKFSFLETKWVTTEDGVPPRHTYRLTPKGGELVRSLPGAVSAAAKVRRPAFGGVRA